jgi:hypothetical protein
MDKRYQGVIRRRKSQKDRQNNGQKIPRGNKKAKINEGQTRQWIKNTKGNKSLSFIDLRLLIIPWYLLSIYLSVFIDVRLLITPWYPLSIVFLSFIDICLLITLGIFIPLSCLSFFVFLVLLMSLCASILFMYFRVLCSAFIYD